MSEAIRNSAVILSGALASGLVIGGRQGAIYGLGASVTALTVHHGLIYIAPKMESAFLLRIATLAIYVLVLPAMVVGGCIAMALSNCKNIKVATFDGACGAVVGCMAFISARALFEKNPNVS